MTFMEIFIIEFQKILRPFEQFWKNFMFNYFFPILNNFSRYLINFHAIFNKIELLLVNFFDI